MRRKTRKERQKKQGKGRIMNNEKEGKGKAGGQKRIWGFSLQELTVKVATARKKEHKFRFSTNGARPESLCNSLEPQIKQQQEQAQN